MIRRNVWLDRWDHLLDRYGEQAESSIASALTLISSKREECSEALSLDEIKSYIWSKSIYIIYDKHLLWTRLGEYMQKKEFFMLSEERDIDDEVTTYIDTDDISPTVWRAEMTVSYIYKDENWDILYFRNPFYEWCDLKLLRESYLKVIDKWVFKENDWVLEEHDEYNERFVQTMIALWYTPMEIWTKSEEFTDELTDLIRNISRIDAFPIIREARY